MKTNEVRAKLKQGKATIGSFMGLGSPNVAELMARTGLDWLVIETEHNALDYAQVEHILMAISGTDTVPLVRVPSSAPAYIQRALDIGALGVLVPMVKTAEEAESIVRATRYPPHGTRGYGPLRAEAYSLDRRDYLARANDNILVALILETKEAVKNLEAIASVPGIDAIYLGPFDLCFSMGLNPLNLPLPEIDAVVEKLLAVCKAQGTAAGNGAGSPEDVTRMLDQGFTFLGYGPDYNLLINALRAGLQAFGR
jgi:4-hydroxy-2-oxoheptanedioate aldolase